MTQHRCHHCGNVLTQLYDVNLDVLGFYMTPTQAQIDAAARALYEASGKTKDWNEIAKAALTAAAEVDTMDAISWMKKEGISTASEIIERANRAIDKATVNATIERCAQVAEEMGRPGTMIVGADKIAAAVRALKDKP